MTETIKRKELVPFKILQRPVYVYLATLPMKLPGRADIFIFGSGLWSGSRREIRRDAVKDRLTQFDKQSYRETTIMSHKSSTVTIDGENYSVAVDTSYQKGSAQITLCPPSK